MAKKQTAAQRAEDAQDRIDARNEQREEDAIEDRAENRAAGTEVGDAIPPGTMDERFRQHEAAVHDVIAHDARPVLVGGQRGGGKTDAFNPSDGVVVNSGAPPAKV